MTQSGRLQGARGQGGDLGDGLRRLWPNTSSARFCAQPSFALEAAEGPHPTWRDAIERGVLWVVGGGDARHMCAVAAGIHNCRQLAR